MMEKACNTEVNNSLSDWLKGMMCDEEGEDEDEKEDPCEKLDAAMCKKAMSKGCMLKDEKFCYYAKAPMGQKALFVKYDWENLMVNDEMTTEAFCYADKEEPMKEITSMTQVTEMCSKAKEADMCKTAPCKWGKPKLSKAEKKEMKKKGTKVQNSCIVDTKLIKKGKVNCKKLDMEMCAVFKGCSIKSKKGKESCNGKPKLAN
jgi:hypothetical protein